MTSKFEIYSKCVSDWVVLDRPEDLPRRITDADKMVLWAAILETHLGVGTVNLESPYCQRVCSNWYIQRHRNAQPEKITSDLLIGIGKLIWVHPLSSDNDPQAVDAPTRSSVDPALHVKLTKDPLYFSRLHILNH